MGEGALSAQGNASTTKQNCSELVACGELPASLGVGAGLCTMGGAWHPALLSWHPQEGRCEFGGVLMNRGVCTLRLNFGPEVMLQRTGLGSCPLSMKEDEDK